LIVTLSKVPTEMRAFALNSYIELSANYPSATLLGTLRLVIWSIDK